MHSISKKICKVRFNIDVRKDFFFQIVLLTNGTIWIRTLSIHLVWTVLKTDWIKLDPHGWVSSWTSPLNPRPCHAGWPQGKATQGKHKVSIARQKWTDLLSWQSDCGRLSRPRRPCTVHLTLSKLNPLFIRPSGHWPSMTSLNVTSRGVVSTPETSCWAWHVTADVIQTQTYTSYVIRTRHFMFVGLFRRKKPLLLTPSVCVCVCVCVCAFLMSILNVNISSVVTSFPWFCEVYLQESVVY